MLAANIYLCWLAHDEGLVPILGKRNLSGFLLKPPSSSWLGQNVICAYFLRVYYVSASIEAPPAGNGFGMSLLGGLDLRLYCAWPIQPIRDACS